MSNPNNKLEQLCNYLLCQIPYLLQRFHSTDIMLRFSVFQFHLQLIKTTRHGKSTSVGCDVKAELRNKAFYTVVPLPSDFQCLLLLSARNAWGRQIRVYEPFFRASKYNIVFKGSVTRLVLSYLNLSEPKNVFTSEKSSISKGIFCTQIWPLLRYVKNQSISKDIRADTTLWRHIFCDAASPDFWREINLTMSYDMDEIQQHNNMNTLSYLFIPTYVISAQSDRLFNSWICSQYALSARSLSRAYRVKRGG